MFLVDSHCHLDSLDYENRFKDPAEVLARAHEAGVTHLLCPGVDLESFPRMYDMIKDLPHVWGAAAMHPENITPDNKDWQDETLEEYLSRDKIAALGETGLDFVCTPETRSIQEESFARQVVIADKMKKPLIIHARGSAAVCLDIINAVNCRDVGGVMHCYCDTVDVARRSLDMGLFISISGIVTFNKGENVREVCRYVPLDRLLVETDSPYLAPVPKRGKPNEPAFVSYTAKAVAELKGVTYETLCNTVSQNFAECFRVTLD